jgi:hypothetical protein
MAIEACTADTLFVLTRSIIFLFKHWGWSLTFIIIIFVLRKIPFVLGGIATFLDFISDTALATIIPIIFSTIATGGLMSFLGLAEGVLVLLFASLIGLLWVGIVLSSKANIILRILALPGAFLTGIVMTFIPYISLPSHMAFEYFVKNRQTANIMCIVPSVLMIILLYFLSGLFCPIISTIMLLLG